MGWRTLCGSRRDRVRDGWQRECRGHQDPALTYRDPDLGNDTGVRIAAFNPLHDDARAWRELRPGSALWASDDPVFDHHTPAEAHPLQRPRLTLTPWDESRIPYFGRTRPSPVNGRWPAPNRCSIVSSQPSTVVSSRSRASIPCAGARSSAFAIFHGWVNTLGSV